MNPEKQHFLDKRITKHYLHFLKEVFEPCKSTEEGVYVCCATAQDRIRMLYKAINSAVPAQEAKAALKIALDTVLLDYGMSVQIHEFM